MRITSGAGKSPIILFLMIHFWTIGTHRVREPLVSPHVMRWAQLRMGALVGRLRERGVLILETFVFLLVGGGRLRHSASTVCVRERERIFDRVASLPYQSLMSLAFVVSHFDVCGWLQGVAVSPMEEFGEGSSP